MEEVGGVERVAWSLAEKCQNITYVGYTVVESYTAHAKVLSNSTWAFSLRYHVQLCTLSRGWWEGMGVGEALKANVHK